MIWLRALPERSCYSVAGGWRTGLLAQKRDALEPLRSERFFVLKKEHPPESVENISGRSRIES